MSVQEENLTRPERRALVSLFTEQQLKALSLEERLDYQTRLLEGLEAPNILEQIFFATRKEAAAIQEAKVAVIKSRRDVIEALGNSLRISVQQEEGLLGARYAANLIATSEVLTKGMHSINEQAIDSLADDYVDTMTSIEGRQGLPEPLRERLRRDAEERLLSRQDEVHKGFGGLLQSYRSLMADFVRDVKKR